MYSFEYIIKTVYSNNYSFEYIIARFFFVLLITVRFSLFTRTFLIFIFLTLQPAPLFCSFLPLFSFSFSYIRSSFNSFIKQRKFGYEENLDINPFFSSSSTNLELEKMKIIQRRAMKRRSSGPRWQGTQHASFSSVLFKFLHVCFFLIFLFSVPDFYITTLKFIQLKYI